MKILKKRPIAILIMIVVILLSILVGGRRSLLAERERVMEFFYTASDHDEYSIQDDIAYISATAINLKTVALRYLAADDPYIVQLNTARTALDAAQTIPEKYDATMKLYSVVGTLYDHLDPSTFQMNATDKSFRTSLYDDITSAMRRIAENEYNTYAHEFNDMVEGGITALIAGSTAIDPIPIFS